MQCKEQNRRMVPRQIARDKWQILPQEVVRATVTKGQVLVDSRRNS